MLPDIVHLSPIQNDRLRGYKGDFLVATIIGEDFSNPLVNTAKVLKMVSGRL